MFKVVPADLVVSGNLTGSYTLTGDLMESPNFVHGVSGWAIFGDGSAEFNNLTIRGTFMGTDFEINPAGIFFYSGTPAAGNLILALAQTAGSDSFGNPYIEGVSVGAAGGQQVEMLIAGLEGVLRFPSGASFENVAGNISAATGGSPAFINLLMSGPKGTLSGHQDWVQAEMNSANNSGTSFASLLLNYIGTGGGVHNYAIMDATGFNIGAGSIVAAHPGTAPLIPETWTTLTLINGYTAGTNNGFTDVPQIRMMADNETLGFKGTLKSPAAGFVNPFAAIPSGYPNANLGGCYGKAVVANLTGGTVDHLQVQNNGNLSLENPAASITYDLSCQVPTQ
jgi:hypothetical protein